MMSLERWVVDVGVSCEILEAGAVFHSPLCPSMMPEGSELFTEEGRDGEYPGVPPV